MEISLSQIRAINAKIPFSKVNYQNKNPETKSLTDRERILHWRSLVHCAFCVFGQQNGNIEIIDIDSINYKENQINLIQQILLKQ